MATAGCARSTASPCGVLIVAHHNKPFGQDMLQEAAADLLGRKHAGSEFAGVGGAVTEEQLPAGLFEYAVAADGRPYDARREAEGCVVDAGSSPLPHCAQSRLCPSRPVKLASMVELC